MNKDIETGKRLLKEFTDANNNMDFVKAREKIEIIINEDFNGGGIKLPLYKTLASKYYWDFKKGLPLPIDEMNEIMNEVIEAIKIEEELPMNPIVQFYYWVYHTILLLKQETNQASINFRSSLMQLSFVKQMNDKIFKIESKGQFLNLLNDEISKGTKILVFDLKINYSSSIH